MSFTYPGKESRRKQLVPPPLKHAKPTWQIDGEDEPPKPQWAVEPQEDGSTRFVQLVAPPIRSDGFSSLSDRSVFTVEITQNTFVGGNHAKAGDVVECFSQTAALLCGVGRILHEQRNAI